MQNPKVWLTTGIKTSCSNKGKLYLQVLYRKSNDPKLKIYYKNYCKILSKVFILAHKMYYNNKLANCTSKPKTTWSIIKTITNNNNNNFNNILMTEIYWKITTHYQTIPGNFNNNYVSVVDITNNNPTNNTIGNLNKINPLNYLYSAFKQSFTNIKIKNINTDEVQKIIEELKV